MASQKRSYDDYNVGWICALPKEQTAATAMLDERHPRLPKPANDTNTYTLGSIGPHNIVIACLPQGQYGTISAATVATLMICTFPSIRVGLMVGIGGGVPPEVRLGDVVVSSPVDQYPGVVQWDFGKMTAGDKFQRTGALNHPPTSLLTALTAIQTEHALGESNISKFLEDLKKKYPMLTKYQKSDSLQDLLFEANYTHVTGPFMDTAGPTNAVVEITQEEVNGGGAEHEHGGPCQFCDRSKTLKREDRPMQVHYGLIASGNKVIKDGLYREKLAQTLGSNVLCIETEASGLMNNFPCLVIRGICDYCDSHKNNDWQEHAAAVAAAFAKELLGYIQPADINREQFMRDILRDAISQIKKEMQPLRDVLDTLRDENKIRKQTEILNWLSLLDFPPLQYEYFRRCEPNTGQEFLKSAEVQDWISTSKQTLFCQGVPGAGKTFQMAILVNYLVERYRDDNTVGVAYLYYNFKRQQEQEAEQMIATLVKQLAQISHPLPEVVYQLYDRHHPMKSRPFLGELANTLTSLIQSFSRVFILIDALDEGSDSDRRKFLAEVFTIQAKTGLNLFATSRAATHHIAAGFEKSICRDISPTRHDIFQFLNSRMSELPSFIANDKALQDEIKESIASAIGEMFLLAQLYIYSLADKRSPGSVRVALKDIHTASSSADRSKVLDEAYNKSMEKIDQLKGKLPRDALLIISWIVKAKRRLKLKEIQEALAVELDKPERNADNIPTVEHITRACASLVIVDGDSVELVHYTAQEYFERPDNRWMERAHADISNTCMTYLKFSAFQCGLGLSWENLSNRFEEYPLYNYATNYWAHHTNEALDMGMEVSKAVDFLEKGQAQSSWYQDLLYGHSPLLFFWDDMPSGLTPLHVAAFFGLHHVVAKLLAQGAWPNTHDSLLRKPIWWATWNGQTQAVKALLSYTTDLETKDKELGQTIFQVAVMQGYETITSLLLGRHNLESKDSLGRTPLILASQYGRQAIAELLLSKGANIEARDNCGQTSLSLAAKSGHENIVKWLLDKGASLETKNNSNRTPLGVISEKLRRKTLSYLDEKYNYVAIDYPGPSVVLDWVKSETIARLLIEKGANKETKDNNSETPLILAVKSAQKDLIKCLTEKGANLEAKAVNGDTLLTLALENENNDIVTHLIENGVNLEATNDRNQTPLILATKIKQKNIVMNLISKGANIEATDIDHQTPLTIAIKSQCRDIIELLIEEDVSINRVMGNGYTALILAIEIGDVDTVNLLIEKGASLSSTSSASSVESGKSNKSPLNFAIEEGRIAIVKALIDKGANLEATNSESRETALVVATQARWPNVMKLLLEKGANTEARDAMGATPLIWAASFGYDEGVKLLLANNANIEAKTNIGHTPLGSAALLGQTNIIQLLLNNNADLEAEDMFGRTPVACATEKGHLLSMYELLSTRRKANVNWRDQHGRTLMHYAVMREHIHCVQFLLGFSELDADEKDNDGRTPLSYAAESKDGVVIGNTLLDSGKVDINTKDNRGRTPLLLAMQHEDKSLMGALLKIRSIDADSKDNEGRTPLRYAMEHDDEAAVSELLESDRVDVNAKDAEGLTPLLYAIMLDKISLVSILLCDEGVDVNIRDDNGRAPLHYAMKHRNTAITELLLRSGKVDTNAEYEGGLTPLFYAIETDDIPLLHFLLTFGHVNTNAVDEKGRTALLYAIERREGIFQGHNLNILEARKLSTWPVLGELLKSEKVDANIADKDGYTILHHIIKRGYRYSFHLLLQSEKVDANIADKEGHTPLLHAITREDKFIITELLEYDKVDANAADKDGYTPLIYSIRKGYKLSMQALLDSGKADARKTDNEGRTTLSHAMEVGDKSIVKALLKFDTVEADAKDNQGRTPLSYAASYGVARILIKAREVDVNSKDELSRTPTWYAAQAGNQELVDLLRRRGARDGAEERRSNRGSTRNRKWN